MSDTLFFLGHRIFFLVGMPSTQDDTYCKACKKKFNNAATFKNHLNSAKHIANEKKFKSKPQQPKQQVKQTPIQGKKKKDNKNC